MRHGFDKQQQREWADRAEALWAQHRHGGWGPGPGFGGPFGAFGPGPGGPGGPRGRGGRPGPPPWLAGLFGLGDPEASRGPKVRRGDVRAAILDVLRAAGEAGEPVNGYQVIQQIAQRSGDAWRPSPGSVYPTVAQLQDEGLVESDDERSRRTLRLTPAGEEYVATHRDELDAVWAPFEATAREAATGPRVDLRPEIGQVMSAVWQIVTTGTDAQRRAAVDVLVDARRKLYGVLADGGDTEETGEETGGDGGGTGGTGHDPVRGPAAERADGASTDRSRDGTAREADES